MDSVGNVREREGVGSSVWNRWSVLEVTGRIRRGIRNSGGWWKESMVSRETTVGREMARGVFIESNIPGKVIFPCHVADMLANSIVFVANKNSLIPSRTTFGSQFRRYRRKTLAPPYMEVCKVRFGTMHDFIGSGVGRKSRGGGTVMEILYS